MVLTSLLASVRALAFDKPPFPRLATNWIGNQNYEQPNIQQQLARGSIALVTVWPNWEANRGTTLEQVITNVKAINPKTLVFDYIINDAIQADRPAHQPFAELYAKLDSTTWWLYPNGTCCTPVTSDWSGNLVINNTLFAPADSNGDRWVEWFAKWAVKNFYVPNPSLDGFYLDETKWKPTVDGDWNRDGTSDSHGGAYRDSSGQWQFDAAPAQQWLRQGLREHFDTMRQLMPGKYQLGNVGDWGDPNSNLTELQGQLNGGFMEAVIGNSWSVETWGGWQAMMAWYRKTMNALAEPKLGIFHQIGSTTDYQGFRYGFASCLMGDGYYTFNSGSNDASSYGDSPWFDEYQAVLGNSVSSSPTGAWQKGVYRRDFQDGIVLVNPKGNGAQTISLEGDFKRISGTQAPSVNSGQTVRSLTLQDRDGIILMRLQPQSTTATATPTAPTTTPVTTTNKMPAAPSGVAVQ